MGLTSKHVFDADARNPLQFFYKFSARLQSDLSAAFGANVGAHAVCLCELGSQFDDHSLDIYMQKRVDAVLEGGVAPPAGELAYCDTSDTVEIWLRRLLEQIGVNSFEIDCHPPYAAIWLTTEVKYISSRWIYDVAQSGNPQRKAIAYQFVQVTVDSGVLPPAENTAPDVDFAVVLNHSPSSENWDTLTPQRKKNAFRNLVQEAGAVWHGQKPTRWLVVGDLNTAEGVLLKDSTNYWHPSIRPDNDPYELRIKISQARCFENKKGDYIVSQGLRTTDFQSNIGCSNEKCRGASDNHNMVIVRGFFIVPAQQDDDTAAATSTALLPQRPHQPPRPWPPPPRAIVASTGTASPVQQLANASWPPQQTSRSSARPYADVVPSHSVTSTDYMSETRRLLDAAHILNAMPLVQRVFLSSWRLRCLHPARSRILKDLNDRFHADGRVDEADTDFDRALLDVVIAEEGYDVMYMEGLLGPLFVPGTLVDSADLVPALRQEFQGHLDSLRGRNPAPWRDFTMGPAAPADLRERAAAATAQAGDDKAGEGAVESVAATVPPQQHSVPPQVLPQTPVPVVVVLNLAPQSSEPAAGGAQPAAAADDDSGVRPPADDTSLVDAQQQVAEQVAPAAMPAGSPAQQAALQVAQQVGNEVQHYSLSSTTELLDELASEAEDSNGDESLCADDILRTIYGNGRHAVDVEMALEEVILFRHEMACVLAERKGHSNGYTAEEWRNWFADHQFQHSEMTEVTELWKNRFEVFHMHAESKQKVQRWWQQNTRESKNNARDHTRNALRAWERQTYGHSHIPRCFLKYPRVLLHDLLRDWARFVQTEDHQETRHRSSINITQAARQQALELKMRCYRLRWQRRMATRLDRLEESGQLGRDAASRHRTLLEYFHSGELDRDLAEATHEHGYGRLHQQGVDLRPVCFMDATEASYS